MPFNNEVCQNQLDINFSTVLVVRSWMNVIPATTDLNTVNLIIGVNTENLSVFNTEVPYGQDIVVPDPCDDTQTITLSNVMLNVAKLNGYIGYYVGAEVLDSSDNVVIESNDNPIQLSNFATTDDVCYVNDMDFFILAPGETFADTLQVSVIDARLIFAGKNDTDDTIYSIVGTFRITRNPVIVP